MQRRSCHRVGAVAVGPATTSCQLPMPFPSNFSADAAGLLHQWARDEVSDLADLLTLRSGREDPAEPPWLALCGFLRYPERVTARDAPSDQVHDPAVASIDRLAKDLQDPANTLDVFFSVTPGSAAEQQACQRALAMARWALMPEPRVLPAWADPQTPLRDLITPLELRLLQRHIDGKPLDPEPGCALTLTVLLVAQNAPPGDRGRLAHLHLWLLPDALAGNGLEQGDGQPVADEVLVRAPQALLLALDPDFAHGLQQVSALLRACLPQPRPALAWSLEPLPMAGERSHLPWGTQAVQGASATVAFALGALHRLRWRLPADVPDMAEVQRRLHRLQPQRVAVTAMLHETMPGPGEHPLDWVLKPITGLNHKLDAFHHFRRDQALSVNRAHAPDVCLVAATQVVPGDALEVPKKASTLAGLLRKADVHQNGRLPKPHAELLQKLMAEELPPAVLARLRACEPDPGISQHDLDTDSDDERPSSVPDPEHWPTLPRLPRELLDAVARHLPSDDPVPRLGSISALECHLLQRLALWAGGYHLQFNDDGAPVKLGDEFTDIAIRPDENSDLVYRWKADRRTDDQIKAYLQVPGLAHLLHHDGRFDGVDVWLLVAAPAAGKTTMLAEYEMQAAWRALRRFAATGRWGEVALWVPLRQLQVLDHDGKTLRPIADVLRDWLAQQPWPLATEWRDLFDGPLAQAHGLRVVPLFDGANELRCNPEQRGKVLRSLLRASRSQRRAGHATPVVTVRTLDAVFTLDGACLAHLQPWNKERRADYVHRRLGEGTDAAKKLLDVVEADDEADDSKRFYANPGLLAIACTLMQQGWLPEPGTNRAQLYATLLWTRIHREAVQQAARAAGPSAVLDWQQLLSAEEWDTVRHLAGRLASGAWGFPEPSGPLLQALREQALHMQWLTQPRAGDGAQPVPGEEALQAVNLDAPEARFFDSIPAGNPARDTLLRAAHAIQLLEREKRSDPNRRNVLQTHWRWRHQTLLEFFAAWSLKPDGPLPDLRIPPGVDLEEDWKRHKAAERERIGAERLGVLFYERPYRLPQAPVSIYEQPVLMAAHLNGDAGQWVTLLLGQGNPELAARVALENWEAFGEKRDHPQDGWRPEGKVDSHGRVITDEALHLRRTHPVLNALRRALRQRMTDPQVHLTSRIRGGFLLGDLGGDDRFAICGEALILTDEHWVRVPAQGDAVHFQMGDLEGDGFKRTADGRLLDVTLPAFELAGLLVTMAQLRCFIGRPGSSPARDPRWWPGAAGRRRLEYPRIFPWDCIQSAWANGSQPATCNFWFAQAYALWESAQRLAQAESAGKGGLTHRPVYLPTEAQWEAAARCGQPAGVARWRFGHTRGGPAGEGQGFADVRPWDLNYDEVFGRPSPVGVFLESAVVARSVGSSGQLHDLAGNVREWTSSAESFPLDLSTVTASERPDSDRLRTLRGGSFGPPRARSAADLRNGIAPNNDDVDNGFRLGRVCAV